MTNKDFKNEINNELKWARISNKVTKVNTDKDLHTTLVFENDITETQKKFLNLRWRNSKIVKKTLTLLHPNEVK